MMSLASTVEVSPELDVELLHDWGRRALERFAATATSTPAERPSPQLILEEIHAAPAVCGRSTTCATGRSPTWRRTGRPRSRMATAGHRSMSTTRQYLHLAGVVFRDDADALARRLLG